MAKHFIMYGTEHCQYCTMAEQRIQSNGDTVTKYVVGKDVTKEEFKNLFPGVTTVPQIILDGDHIGGYDDLNESYTRGQLNG